MALMVCVWNGTLTTGGLMTVIIYMRVVRIQNKIYDMTELLLLLLLLMMMMQTSIGLQCLSTHSPRTVCHS